MPHLENEFLYYTKDPATVPQSFMLPIFLKKLSVYYRIASVLKYLLFIFFSQRIKIKSKFSRIKSSIIKYLINNFRSIYC